MKNHKILSVLIFALLGISISVAAHDPKEHAKENKAPDCSTMKDMKSLEANDMVAMAIMKKCRKMMDKDMKMDGHTEHHSKAKVKIEQKSKIITRLNFRTNIIREYIG